jgi:hypothetical protein
MWKFVKSGKFHLNDLAPVYNRVPSIPKKEAVKRVIMGD